MSKRLFISLLFIFVFIYNVKSADSFHSDAAFFSQNDESYFYHTIERGQTVFSIAKMYHVTVEDINRLNPESREGIRAGDVLKVPQESGSYIYHTIEPKENLYSVSKKYYMKGDDIINVNPGLSVETFTIGRVIRIPTNIVTEPIQGGNESVNQQITNSLLRKSDPPARQIGEIRVALLLPFGLKEKTTVENVYQNRFVEYYEGFLLAVNKMKQKGVSIRLKVYDTGSNTTELMNLVKNNTLQNMDLLIGGLSNDQIKILSQYSKDNNIPYVVPITSTSNVVLDNSRTFQINTPQPYLYSKASLAFINRYKNDCIFLVKESTSSNKTEFIQQLEDDLNRNNIKYNTIEFGSSFAEELALALDKSRNNVIVPSNDSPETLSRLLPLLKMQADTNPSTSISLFGYPSWQGYGADYSEDFFRLNATFYSFFYANPTSMEVKEFHNTFYRWYSREIMNRFPKYGILGYDTGRFFMELLNRYGRNFDSYVNDMYFNGVQTDFTFDRINNWSGFVNSNLYLIEYTPDYMITKTIVK